MSLWLRSRLNLYRRHINYIVELLQHYICPTDPMRFKQIKSSNDVYQQSFVMRVNWSFSRKCKNSDVPFQPPVYDIADNGTEILVNNTLLPIYIKLQCSDRHEIKNIKLYADGRMYRIETGVFYSQNNYCLDYFKNANKEAQLRAQICLKEFGDSAQTKKGSWKYVLMLGGLIPSIICLVLTLIVYAILSSLRNVHGYYVMCYVAFLLISYIFLFVIQWMQDALSLYQCILFGKCT